MSFTVKWLGHASFKMDIDGKIVYTDPYRGEYSEKADLILITHSHGDHCNVSKIQKACDKDTVIVAPADCSTQIRGSIRTLRPGEETTIAGIRVKAVEAYNTTRFRSPGMPFHPKGFGVGYLITALGKTVYQAGDTDFIPEMRQLGRINLALLPSGGTYTMDNAEAADAAVTINPDLVVPIHRWDTKPDEFRKKVEVNSNIRVVTLEKGEEYQVV